MIEKNNYKHKGNKINGRSKVISMIFGKYLT